MKKLIAAALAILLGSTGYVIVDHTLEGRVEKLEEQLSSQQVVISSMEELLNTTYLKPTPMTTTTRKTTTTTKTTDEFYSTGDKIKLDKRQRYKFSVVYVKGYYDYGDVQSPYSKIYDVEYSDDIIDPEVTETYRSNPYDVTLTELSAEVVDYQEIEKSTLYDYTTYVFNEYSTKIKVTIKGHTSPDLAGKKIRIDMKVLNYGYTPPTTTRTPSGSAKPNDFCYFTVKNDGSFETVGYTTVSRVPKSVELYFYNLHSY